MSRLLSLLLLVLAVGVARSASTNQTQAGPITCFVCWNCLTYEPAVQAKQCEGEGEHFCLVILILHEKYFILYTLFLFRPDHITDGVLLFRRRSWRRGA